MGAGPPRPYLWVRVINTNKGAYNIVKALLDTGADESAFPKSMARTLGYNLRNVSPKRAATAKGPTLAYGCKAIIEFLGINKNGKLPVSNSVDFTCETNVDFVKGLGAFLIGRGTFENYFVITFNYGKGVFSIEKAD